MLVLLNGGRKRHHRAGSSTQVPLADACVTEWRIVATTTLMAFCPGATR